MAEGDAMKADKRRKKKQKEAEQAQDPIFGGSDSDDGGDYNPDAAEEPEYIEAGTDQGQEPAEEDEGYQDMDEDKTEGTGRGKVSRKRLLAETGTAIALDCNSSHEGVLTEMCLVWKQSSLAHNSPVQDRRNVPKGPEVTLPSLTGQEVYGLNGLEVLT